MPLADLSDVTVARLQKHAKPLTDTYETVISRLLDFYEAGVATGPKSPGEPIKIEANVMWFDPHNPPPLGFTTLTHVVLNGEHFPKSETYWNRLMHRVILEAGKLGYDKNTLSQLLSVNMASGEKTDNGYTYLSAVDISVQGQDSNGAFRQAFQLAEAIGAKLKVCFYWQGNQKAAFPNQRGILEI